MKACFQIAEREVFIIKTYVSYVKETIFLVTLRQNTSKNT